MSGHRGQDIRQLLVKMESQLVDKLDRQKHDEEEPHYFIHLLY